MNPAVFVAFIPMVFSGAPDIYVPPQVDHIQTMIPNEEPVILPVCVGCILQQNDESEIIAQEVWALDLLATSNEIMVTLKDGQRSVYGLEQMWLTSGPIDEDLPDLWIKSTSPTPRTLHYRIKR